MDLNNLHNKRIIIRKCPISKKVKDLYYTSQDLSPHFQSVLAELSPANQGRDADPCCVEPDKEESEEGGERGGERELSVLGHHHVPLECQDCQRDDGLDP